MDSAGRQQLLGEALRGDESALKRLFGHYRSYLALLARLQVDRELQAKVDASDLVQEALLQAHQDFPRFRGKTDREFVQWLRRILAHTIANLVRRYVGTQQRDVRLEEQFEQQLDGSSIDIGKALLARESSPSENAARHERAARLASALAELPDNSREVMILREIRGLSTAEVALRMGKTTNSIQKLRARAIVRLRQLLGDDE